VNYLWQQHSGEGTAIKYLKHWQLTGLLPCPSVATMILFRAQLFLEVGVTCARASVHLMHPILHMMMVLGNPLLKALKHGIRE
jgi:hypothetical protein